MIVRRTLQGIHGAFELGVYIPCVGRVEFVLKFGLTGDKCIHLIGILKHIGVGKTLVHLVKLCEKIHYGLHTFAHHLDNRLRRIKLRILLKIAHRVAGREHNLALEALVNTCDDLQQR